MLFHGFLSDGRFSVVRVSGGSLFYISTHLNRKKLGCMFAGKWIGVRMTARIFECAVLIDYLNNGEALHNL